MWYPSRNELAALSDRISWNTAGVVLSVLVGLAAVVLGGFGLAGYLRADPAPAQPTKSWFIRPALLNPDTSFFALDPNAPNPSYIPFQTETGPSIGTTFSLGGSAFDVSHENYTTVLTRGLYEFTLHVTLISVSSGDPTVGVVMMNSTEPALTVPILLGSFGTLSNVTQLPYLVRAATGSATILLDAGTTLYIPYLVTGDVFVTPGTYWSGALLFEIP